MLNWISLANSYPETDEDWIFHTNTYSGLGYYSFKEIEKTDRYKSDNRDVYFYLQCYPLLSVINSCDIPDTKKILLKYIIQVHSLSWNEWVNSKFYVFNS